MGPPTKKRKRLITRSPSSYRGVFSLVPGRAVLKDASTLRLDKKEQNLVLSFFKETALGSLGKRNAINKKNLKIKGKLF